jgi:hypothetical protein
MATQNSNGRPEIKSFVSNGRLDAAGYATAVREWQASHKPGPKEGTVREVAQLTDDERNEIRDRILTQGQALCPTSDQPLPKGDLLAVALFGFKPGKASMARVSEHAEQVIGARFTTASKHTGIYLSPEETPLEV